jgi:glycosyltransferase involved in cell wall biosynthesis
MLADPSSALVSCLMVTQPGSSRYRPFLASLASLRNQRYPRLELIVIASRGDATWNARFHEQLQSLNIPWQWIPCTGDPTLGTLRNRAVEHAQGEILCQWDDDDLSHPERISQQVDHLVRHGYRAVFLDDSMHFFAPTGELYWECYARTPYRCLTSTGIVRRGDMVRYPESGPRSRRGEDSDVVERLLEQGGVGMLSRAPHLYVYIWHGSNTWGEDHHRLLSSTLAVSTRLIDHRREELMRHLFCLMPLLPGASLHGSPVSSTSLTSNG